MQSFKNFDVPSMFDFEDDAYGGIQGRKAEMYDMDLAIAVSSSLRPSPGAQILDPLEVQKLVARQIEEIAGEGDAG